MLHRTWLEPIDTRCPNGAHVVWRCVERMAMRDVAVERTGAVCGTCRWEDLPPYVEGSPVVTALPIWGT